MFKNARLGTRLLLAFSSLVLLGSLVAAFGIHGLYRLNKVNDDLYQKELLGISYVKEANINLMYAARARLSFALATNDVERDSAARALKESVGTMRGLLDKAKPLFYSAQGQAEFDKLDRMVQAWVPVSDAYITAAAAKGLAVADPQLQHLDQEVRQANKLVDDQLTVLTRLKEKNGEEAAKTGTDMFEFVSLVMALLTVASGVCGVTIGVVLTRSVTRSLGGEPESVAEVANAVAMGDLSTTIDTSRAAPGSVVAAMNHMQQSLRKVVSQVRSSSDSIATGAAQIATGNADLSQRTEEQASNLQQTAASMEQLTATVKTNADTAHQATQLAGSAMDAAGQGGQAVELVVRTMEGITASSKKISDIIGVIDGIAFQTNILALNAAVEAARAGEQGRGFAVVANEVRTLAQRSASAAKEIKGLITESVEKVEAGSSQVVEAGRAMDNIVAQVKRVNDLIGEIESATNEQTQGIGQIGEAVGQLDQVTQQNAALVEESAAAAESLNQQAARLVEAVAVFTLNGDEAMGGHSRKTPVQTTVVAKPVKATVKATTKPATAKAATKAKPLTSSPVATAANHDDDGWSTF